MAMYIISRCEPARTFAKKDGSGDGQMQKIVLRDDAGKDYKTTMFSVGEAFVGDIVEATLKGYSDKFREYQFTLKTIAPGPRGIPNTPKEPTISVEPEKGGSYTRSPEESQRIVRQSTLKAVADLFSGKGDPERIGAYLALADQMTEWCMTWQGDSSDLQGGAEEPCDPVWFGRRCPVRCNERLQRPVPTFVDESTVRRTPGWPCTDTPS